MSDPNFSLFPRVLNGAIAATAGTLVIFPLDLVKTRLQNQHVSPTGEKQYSSLFDCFVKTVKQDGVRGLYRGLGVNISLVGVEKGLKLAANDYCRFLLSSETKRLTLFRQALAGAGAGVVQMMVSCPMELLKIQLQDSGRVAAEARKAGKEVKSVTAIGIAMQLFKEKGIFGLYRGIVATAYRDISFAMVYFPLYAYIEKIGPQQGEGDAKLYWHLVCGLLSGAFSAWICTPFDVLKTRFQAIAKSEGQTQYRGLWHCFTDTMAKEGITAFFKGGACRVIVIAPLYAIAQMVYYIGVAEFILGVDRQKSVK